MLLFRAACGGHIRMDELDSSYIVHLIKTSGLSIWSYFLHWKSFGISLSDMAWFLFIVADFFPFSEIEATIAEASEITSWSEPDVSGQPPSWSALGSVTVQNMN